MNKNIEIIQAGHNLATALGWKDGGNCAEVYKLLDLNKQDRIGNFKMEVAKLCAATGAEIPRDILDEAFDEMDAINFVMGMLTSKSELKKLLE